MKGDFQGFRQLIEIIVGIFLILAGLGALINSDILFTLVFLILGILLTADSIARHYESRERIP